MDRLDFLKDGQMSPNREVGFLHACRGLSPIGSPEMVDRRGDFVLVELREPLHERWG
jgi:hypothetical protein